MPDDVRNDDPTDGAVTSDNIREILRNNNPFSSSSAGNPWDGGYPDGTFINPDVTSINEDVYNGILGLVQSLQENPCEPKAVLVLGETGFGKTHLIGRLRRQGLNGAMPYSFAYIQPLINPNRPFRYLLREVVINLCRNMNAPFGHTQLDLLVKDVKSNFSGRSDNKPGDDGVINEKIPWLFLGKEQIIRRLPALNIPGLRRILVGLQGAKRRVYGWYVTLFATQQTGQKRSKAGMLIVGSRLISWVSVVLRMLDRVWLKIWIRPRAPADDLNRIEQETINFLRNQEPALNASFLKVLFRYTRDATRTAAADWLMGNVIEREVAQRLGVDDREKNRRCGPGRGSAEHSFWHRLVAGPLRTPYRDLF